MIYVLLLLFPIIYLARRYAVMSHQHKHMGLYALRVLGEYEDIKAELELYKMWLKLSHEAHMLSIEKGLKND